MAVRPQLLIVGDEITLLQTREMMLGTRFTVYVAARLSEALHLMRLHQFEIILVCRATESWGPFAEVVKEQKPATNIVVVTSEDSESPNWADRIIPCTKGPFELFKVCSEMFGMERKTKALGFSDRSWKKPVPIG
jgi:hypothetical protein